MKSEDSKKFTEYYKKNKVTGTYDSQREATEYRRKKRRVELKSFLRLLDKKDKEKVLELGCSSGFLTKHLGKVTAIDTSEGMLEIAHSKNPRAKCIHADMFELPFKNSSFDKVITMRVWNHLDSTDIKKAILESKRVLKKKGHLIFDIENKSRLRRIASVIYKILFNPTGYKIYQYSLKEIKNILGREGFRIEKTISYPHKIGRQTVLRAKIVN